jgi:hypothetical protein
VEGTKVRKFLAAGVGILALTGTAAAEIDSYSCTESLAAGLHFDRTAKIWQPQQFASGVHYVLRKLNDDDAKGDWKSLYLEQPNSMVKQMFLNADWVLVRDGYTIPSAFCWSNFGLFHELAASLLLRRNLISTLTHADSSL